MYEMHIIVFFFHVNHLCSVDGISYIKCTDSYSEYNMSFEDMIHTIDAVVWGPLTLFLLVGTGIYLTLRTGFLTWKNLLYALKITLSKEARSTKGKGDVTSFSALTTTLAATIGTGNIVGVAIAMVAGGPGALIWMLISSCFGMSTMFAECMLSVKYREMNENGEMSGGPMYTMKNGIRNKPLGRVLGWWFALFAVFASFGIGNMTQSNSIALVLYETFAIPVENTGIVVTVAAILIIVGGIKSISKVSSVVVPIMACFYMICALIVIIGNIENVPSAIRNMFVSAFSLNAVSGGVAGTAIISAMEAIRYGIARGVFSNEAGMGSSAITAAAASTDSHVKQGYISMTGAFWDTIVVCSVTGLAIATSGVLETVEPEVVGTALTVRAFETVLGSTGGLFISIGITMFAFATILGWEYNGEKAFEYIAGTSKWNMAYRILFSYIAFVGATQPLELVWNLSDIANALMVMPNLICVLLLSNEVVKDVKEYEREVK